MIYLDFAQCRCGSRTPIRPSRPVIPGEDQRWTETGTETLFVACSECKRVYSVDTKELIPAQATHGLSPYHPDAPLHVFHVSIECAEELHCLPIEVLAVRNTDTSIEALQKETTEWKGVGLKCPRGHVQSFPSEWE